MQKLTNGKMFKVLEFLAKKHHRKSEIHNIPIISNVRVTETGFMLNLRVYNRKTKSWDKKKDVEFDDKAVITVLEFQMNYRSEEDMAMMRKDYVFKEQKVKMKEYKAAKFGTAKPKPQNKKTDFTVVVMDEKRTRSGRMDIGEVHDLLSEIL